MIFLVQRLERRHLNAVYVAATDYVFCDEGDSRSTRTCFESWCWYPALERAGIARVRRGSGLHPFRHTAASLVQQQTGSVKLAPALLRHARLSTTANIYTHVSNAERELMAEALRQAPPPVRGRESPALAL